MKTKDTDEYVMYVLVNNNLKMGKGKIASQCMHSACNVTRILERRQRKDPICSYLQWIKNGETKIVLKSTETEMQNLIDKYEVDLRVKRDSTDIWCVYTRDFGRTQVAVDSLTTLAFRPMLKTNIPPEIKKLTCL